MKTKNCISQSAIRNLPRRSLQAKAGRQPSMAFTIIELLVVIAIIAILAAMLLPVLGSAQTHARITQAKLQVNQISTAITQYESQYSRFPVSNPVQQSGMTNITYGGVYSNSAGAIWPLPATAPGWNTYDQWLQTPYRGIYIASNSDVIAILMDFTNFPNSPTWTVNTNYQKNPMQTTFLNAKMVGDTVSPGVGTDLNYRDPWGNPYTITIDLNGDNSTEDPFYGTPSVSSATGLPGGTGINGLIWQNPTGATTGVDNNYAFHGNVMVWSMGPNGPFNHSPSSFDYAPTLPAGNTVGMALDANNKRHIVSWAQ